MTDTMKTLHHPRRRAAVAAIGAALGLLLAPASWAAGPASNAPIKLVVPFAAGGGTDGVARAVAQVLSEKLGQTVIVDNRPGAGGSIGTLAVVQAPADGLTLLLGSNGTMVLNPALYPNLKYKVDRDLVPVGGIASLPYLIAANPKFPGNDIKGLLATAKTRTVTFASPGNGTTNHLVGVLLESLASVPMTHVPYRGAAPAMNDVISGQVDFLSGDLGTLLPQVQAGKLKPLAVTGAKRIALLPKVPTVAEQGLAGFDASGWFGVFAPRGTPAAVVDRLAPQIQAAVADPRVTQRLHDLGASAMPLMPDQLKSLVGTETAKWHKVITDNKVTADALQ